MNTHEDTLEIARSLIHKNPSLKDWVVSKFPELKESEDERIRKNMREFLLDAPSQDIVNHHLDLEETLAWLEKQGEQKPVEWSKEDERVIIAIKEAVSYYWSDDSQAKTDILAWIEQQKEQKSAKWSNEDKGCMIYFVLWFTELI